ncbi:MAG: TRAP transporter large permease [Deltaproteobacteria bacterium]|nr:TRAP transporter large permease [Deltaproteobacteria bacterium]MBW2077748.1 TRAP transporter large permease [Deltaproteobacteria bacterium]
MDVIVDLAILIGLLVLGVPVPFCFMAAVLYLFISGGYDPMFIMATGFHKINSMAVLCILFFILMGGLMTSGGIASRLVAISDAILGRTKSGLGTVSIVSCAIFGAIAGTCTAAVAAIGSIMIPRMVERGYPRGQATALVAAPSVLGQLIPPSVPMILYAWVTWQSVAACFLSTVVPGIIMIGFYSTVNWFMCRKLPITVMPSVGLVQQMKAFGHAVNKGFFALLMPVIVLGGIYGGVFTPTEAAGIAVLYCIPVGFIIYHTMNVRQFTEAMITAITTTGVIILMVFFVMILSRLYIMENVPQRLISTLIGFTDNKFFILLMVNVFLLILGMLMDDFSGTLLAAPLLFPLMKEIGIHPVHFAAILGTNLGLGNKTPPTAPILYLAGRIGNCSLDKLIKPQMIFIVTCSVPVVLITTYFPPLSLALPHLIMPKLVPHIPLTAW